MTALYPLRFHPVFMRYLWGGRRLETSLNKPLAPGNDWAESWEICDLGPQQSIVASGPLVGASLGQLVAEHGKDLLGKDHPQPRFPLLLKFLDAAKTLSVQVHPGHGNARVHEPPEASKTEAWVVLEAEPESQIYAGLKPGLTRDTLADAVRHGRCEECLHAFHPSPGDCVFLPAGTVHALGAGLLVAEIQQPSNVTYRLFDWNRLGHDGHPRPLHIEQGLDSINFEQGPVGPQKPRAADRPEVSRLVECEHFRMDRWQFDRPTTIGGDDRCHIVTVLEGELRVSGDPVDQPLVCGNVVLLPASLGETKLNPSGEVVLLDCYRP